jgi:hypothetical protein
VAAPVVDGGGVVVVDVLVEGVVVVVDGTLVVEELLIGVRGTASSGAPG